MKYSTLSGTGSYLPSKVLTNKDLEQIIDTTDEWIVSRSGIRERHVAAEDESASTMGLRAAQAALDAAKLSPEDIDLIIVATSTPDNTFPSTACLIQEGLSTGDCAAFDISAACAGFVYALGVADNFIRAGSAQHALVIGSECMTRSLDWDDRTTCVLFGDGAGAFILSSSDKPGIESVHLHADGKQKDILTLKHPGYGERANPGPATLQMKGSDVFKFAVTHLEGLVTEALNKHQLAPEEINWLVPHQANIRIIQSIAKRLNLSMDNVLLTIEKHGNTSAASIPLALDEGIRSGKIRRGERMLLEAFGGGLVWGSAILVY